MLKLSESKYEKNSGDTDGIGDIFGFYNLNSCSKAVVLDVWIDLNALIGVWFYSKESYGFSCPFQCKDHFTFKKNVGIRIIEE